MILEDFCESVGQGAQRDIKDNNFGRHIKKE